MEVHDTLVYVSREMGRYVRVCMHVVHGYVYQYTVRSQLCAYVHCLAQRGFEVVIHVFEKIMRSYMHVISNSVCVCHATLLARRPPYHHALCLGYAVGWDHRHHGHGHERDR